MFTNFTTIGNLAKLNTNNHFASLDLDVQKSIMDQEKDSIIDFEDYSVQICIDPQSSFMLDETIVDYETSLAQSGFKFVNPKAQRSCGCGQSFG